MSLILDALRKAEQDRKIGKPPGINRLAIEARAGRPKGMWAGFLIAAGALLGLVGYLVWQLGQQQRLAPTETAVADQLATKTVSAPPATETNSDLLSGSDTEKSSLSSAVSNLPSADITTTEMPIDATPSAESRTTNLTEVEILEQDNAGAKLQPMIGAYRHLSAKRRTEIGLLKLNVHVFASEPEDRFVLINMQRLGENDALNARLKVLEIGEFGVLMDYAGLRFRLLKQ